MRGNDNVSALWSQRCRNAGSTNKWKVTYADTGLPGRPNTNDSLLWTPPFLVAKVIGFLDSDDEKKKGGGGRFE